MLVHAAEIAGHEPAFPVQRHRGGGWAVEIPAHHAIAADLDLADLAQRQDLSAGRVGMFRASVTETRTYFPIPSPTARAATDTLRRGDA